MVAAQPDQQVTVIGAGIIGICSALSLLEKGNRVRIIDPLDDLRRGTYGNAGVISPWSCVPQSVPGLWSKIPGWLLDPQGPVSLDWSKLIQLLPWTFKFLSSGTVARVEKISDAMSALNRPNLALYHHHLADTGKSGLIKDACYLHVYRKKSDLDPNGLNIRLLRQHGATVRLLSSAQLRELEPAISPDYATAMQIESQGRAVSPDDLRQALTEKAISMGAQFIPKRVTAIKPAENGSWQVEAGADKLDSARLVIAAGIWSKQLLATLGIKVPLMVERGYHLEFRNPGIELNHSIMDVSRKFVVSSMTNGIRTAGTAEFAGLDSPPNYQRAQLFAGMTRQLLPGLNIDSTEPWMGIRPSFPDSLPCIGEVPGFQNLFAAFGHSHYGLCMAPKTGQVIADIVNQIEPDIDIYPYRFERF